MVGPFPFVIRYRFSSIASPALELEAEFEGSRTTQSIS
jgi:hypothetical protein